MVERSTKLLLGIHTATPVLEIGIGDFYAGSLIPLHVKAWEIGRGTSSLVHGYLEQTMGNRSWQELACVAVALGEGSYTGTRVGVVLARTLGQQLNIPVYGETCADIEAHRADRSVAAVWSLMEMAYDRWRGNPSSCWQNVLPMYSS